MQVAYLHELEDLKEPDVFPLLLRFVASAGVWAINLGEIAFSAAQVEQLAHAADVGGVGFAFVENKYLQGEDGQTVLRIFKDALWGVRRRRREQGFEPWLLTNGADPRQDRLIKSVRKMFWNPCSLGQRNKRLLSGDERRDIEQEEAAQDAAASAAGTAGEPAAHGSGGGSEGAAALVPPLGGGARRRPRPPRLPRRCGGRAGACRHARAWKPRAVRRGMSALPRRRRSAPSRREPTLASSHPRRRWPTEAARSGRSRRGRRTRTTQTRRRRRATSPRCGAGWAP